MVSAEMCGASASRAQGSAGSSIAIEVLLADGWGFRSLSGRRPPPAACVQRGLHARLGDTIWVCAPARAPGSTKVSNGRHRTHQGYARITSDRVVHEGYATVPDVRLLQPYRAGAEGGRCRIPFGQRAGGS